MPLLEQLFNKGKDKNIAGLPQLILRPQPRLVIVLYFQAININPYQLQLHLLAAGSFTDNHFQEHLFKKNTLTKD